MTKRLKCVLVSLSIALLFACGQEPIPNQVEKTGAEKQAVSPPTTPPANTDTVDIRLLPERPKSGECLKAIVTGKKDSLVLQWRVNGVELPEQRGNSLCDADLRRDDLVEAYLAGTEIRAEVTISNTPPRILEVSANVEAFQQREGIRIVAVTTDSEGDEVELRYRWLINDEEDPFSITETLAADRYRKGDRIQVEVTPFDGFDEGNSLISRTLTIPNTPPHIVSSPPAGFTDSQYIYQIQAVDPDGDELIYRLDEAPAGMSIDEAGQVLWSLTEVTPGTYPIKITVEDPDGGKITQTFTITLVPPAR